MFWFNWTYTPTTHLCRTITEDVSTADCYSYAKDEDGPVKIPNLKELLEKRGIMVAGL